MLSREPIEYGKFGWDKVKALLQALLVSGPATRREAIASRYAESTLVPEAGLIASRHIALICTHLVWCTCSSIAMGFTYAAIR